MTNRCLSLDQLRMLVDGLLDAKIEANVIVHLDACPHCLSQLDQINQSALLSKTNEDRSATSGENTLLNDRLQAIRQNRPNPKPQKRSGFDDVRLWIAKSPGHLGRINNFALTEFVGRGGMGVVFKAIDSNLERVVAIKLMSPSLLNTEDAVERFLREARAAARINHRNVVTVHAVDQVNGLPFLVMEWVQGNSLDIYVQGVGKLSEPEILRLAIATSDGLSAAHQQGVIHRDIKPGNLLIDRDSKSLKIADFGLAYPEGDNALTRTGMLVGTPEYSSPEQVEGLPTDARSDLFSLGSVLYMLCTNSSPFASDSLIETLTNVRDVRIAGPKLSSGDTPQPLCRIVEKLLQRAPDDRFQSADDLSRHLRLLASGKETNFQIETRVAKTKTSFKVPMSFLWTVAAVVLLTLLTGYFLWPLPLQNGGHISKADANEQAVIVQSNEELREALLGKGDLTIQLAGGSSYELDRDVRIVNRNLTFRGSRQDRPSLTLTPQGNASSLYLRNGKLTFDGINILDASNNSRDESAIWIENGELEFQYSALQSPRRQICCQLVESKLMVNHSVLVSGDTIFSVAPPLSSPIAISDSVLVSLTNFELDDNAEISMKATKCQFAGFYTFEVSSNEIENLDIHIEGEDCRFRTHDAIFGVHLQSEMSPRDVANDIAQHIKWNMIESQVPRTILVYDGGTREYNMTWKQTRIDIGNHSSMVEVNHDQPIGDLVKRFLKTRFETVQQAAELLTRQ